MLGESCTPLSVWFLILKITFVFFVTALRYSRRKSSRDLFKKGLCVVQSGVLRWYYKMQNFLWKLKMKINCTPMLQKSAMILAIVWQLEWNIAWQARWRVAWQLVEVVWRIVWQKRMISIPWRQMKKVEITLLQIHMNVVMLVPIQGNFWKFCWKFS